MSFWKQVEFHARGQDTPANETSWVGARSYGQHDEHAVYMDEYLVQRDGTQTKIDPFGFLQKSIDKETHIGSNGYEVPGWGLVKNNKVVWQKQECIHHELCITPQKTILTCTKEIKLHAGRPIDFDVIVEYNFQGECIRKISLYDIKDLRKLHGLFAVDIPFIPVPKRKSPSPWGGIYDYYRLNAMQVLQESPISKAGDILLTLRHASIVCVLRENKIVWHLKIPGLEGPHAAQLHRGFIYLFDNGRYRGWSRVLKINPVTHKIVWEFSEPHFFSESQGYVQPLANGNLLVTSSNQGWVFEITEQKKIGWEYKTPLRNTDKRFPQSVGKPKWIYRAYIQG